MTVTNLQNQIDSIQFFTFGITLNSFQFSLKLEKVRHGATLFVVVFLWLCHDDWWRRAFSLIFLFCFLFRCEFLKEKGEGGLCFCKLSRYYIRVLDIYVHRG